MRWPRWAHEIAATFPNDWERATIGEIGTLISGSTPSRAKYERYFANGKIPWIKTGDLTNGDVLETEECITDLAVKECRCLVHPPGTVLVAMYGGFQQIGRTGLVRVPSATNQAITAIRLHPDAGISPEFLQSWLNSMRATWRHIAGSSRKDPNISKAHVASFPVPLPAAAVVEKIDGAISCSRRTLLFVQDLISEKRRFKKGMLQQLLTGKMRFPEFVGRKWGSSRLGDHVKAITRRNSSGINLVLTASGAQGLVDQRRYFNRSVAGVDLTRYYLLRRGEFAYNRSAMNGYPYGATKRLDSHEEGALSTLYLCFEISDPKLDSDYLMHVFESGALSRQLRPIIRIGARAHGLLNVSEEDYFSINIPFPDVDEQKRIANILSTLDKEIELLEAQRNLMARYGRGLLSKLLSGEIAVPA